MALYNLRRVATTTTGTGTITLGSTVTGFKAFTDAPAIPDQTWVTYAIADTSNSEIGYGLYSTSGATLTRNVIESTNSNTAISLTGSAQVFITPTSGDIQSDTAFPNRIRNGGMDIWQRGTSAITITTAGAYTADGWIVLPTGASVTAAQASGRLLTANSLQVTGAASVTDVIIKQRIESLIAAAMTSQQVVLQAWIFNSTGGSITPTLTVKHPNSADNYAGTTTDVSAVNLQPCANSAWTQVMYAFTASASSANGMEISIDFSNNFSSGAKTIQLAEVDLRVAPGYPTGLTQIAPEPQFRPVHEELLFCQRYFLATYDPGTTPGTATRNGLVGFSTSLPLSFPVKMRIAPTSFLYWDGAGNASKVSSYSAGWTDNETGLTNIMTGAGSALFTCGSTNSPIIHYTATAEL